MQPRISPVAWDEMFQRLTQCGYRFPSRVQDDMTKLRSDMPQGLSSYVASIPGSPPLFLVKGPLFPAPLFPGAPQVEYVVTITQNFPNSFPVITIEQPPAGWQMKVHRNVDRKGCCFLQSVASWNPTKNTVLECVLELQRAFSADYPFVNPSRPQPTPAQMQQQQQAQQPQRQQQMPPAQVAAAPRPMNQPPPPQPQLVQAMPVQQQQPAVAQPPPISPQALAIGNMIAGATTAYSGRTDDAAMRQREEDRAWLEQHQRRQQQFVDPDSSAYAASVDRFSAMIQGQPVPPGTEVPLPMGFGFCRFISAPNPALPLQAIDSIPFPLPPVTEPTPDQLHEQISQQEKAKQQMATAQVASTPPSTGTFGGAFKALSMAGRKVSELASDAARGVENSVREQQKQKDRDRFANAFPQFASCETLITDYPCRSLAGDGTNRKGHVFVTNRGVHFSTKLFPAEANVAVYQYSIALSDIVSIVRGECGGEEWIHLVCVDCTFRSIYAVETGVAAKMGSYMSSSLQGTPNGRFYNWLDHMWRAATRVPNPSFSYGGVGGVPTVRPPGAVAQQQPGRPLAASAPPPAPLGKGGDDVMCAVCMDKPKNAFFQPCGHVCCCMACASKVNQCPLCRAPVAQTLMAFL